VLAVFANTLDRILGDLRLFPPKQHSFFPEATCYTIDLGQSLSEQFDVDLALKRVGFQLPKHDRLVTNTEIENEITAPHLHDCTVNTRV